MEDAPEREYLGFLPLMLLQEEGTRGERRVMEHHAEYKLGRYRVVEKVEKVQHGYEWRVTAFDDETARELPWNPPFVIRFDAGRVVSSLEEAQRELVTTVALLKREISTERQ